MDCIVWYKMGLISIMTSLIASQQQDLSILLFEFEEVAIVATGFLLLLMYMFYVRYPYNKET